MRLLGQRRAQEVKEQLIRGHVEADRIFVVEPKSLAADRKDKLRSSRVDFVLR
jgi:outer membrane protein OmpA-like peptidoglycan-associated protein